MSSTAQKTLDTPELLEAILLELPPQSVLLSQRVNKTFKVVTDGSIKLQQHLFFKQRTPQSTDKIQVNPFLAPILQLYDLRGGILINGPADWRTLDFEDIPETYVVPADATFTIRIGYWSFHESRAVPKYTSYERMFIVDSAINVHAQLAFRPKWDTFTADTLGEVLKERHAGMVERGLAEKKYERKESEWAPKRP